MARFEPQAGLGSARDLQTVCSKVCHCVHQLGCSQTVCSKVSPGTVTACFSWVDHQPCIVGKAYTLVTLSVFHERTELIPPVNPKDHNIPYLTLIYLFAVREQFFLSLDGNSMFNVS